MIVSQEAFVMLLTEPFFKGFTKREICNTSTHTEGMFALSCSEPGRGRRDRKKAIAAGGSHAIDPQDHGFMYGWSFYDIDGHHWEVVWMGCVTVCSATDALDDRRNFGSIVGRAVVAEDLVEPHRGLTVDVGAGATSPTAGASAPCPAPGPS